VGRPIGERATSLEDSFKKVVHLITDREALFVMACFQWDGWYVNLLERIKIVRKKLWKSSDYSDPDDHTCSGLLRRGMEDKERSAGILTHDVYPLRQGAKFMYRSPSFMHGEKCIKHQQEFT